MLLQSKLMPRSRISTCPRGARATQGFTLIELMIVVVIIGILAAIAIPRFSGVSKSAKQSEAHSVLKQIYSLQEAYYQRGNTYAGTLTDRTATNYLAGYEPPEMKYFGDPVVASGGTTTFCIGFDPNAAGPQLEPRSIDQQRVFYRSTNCGGAAVDP